MRSFRHFGALKVLVLAALALAVAGFAVMKLVNSLLPALAGWHTVTFLQAVGLLVLCRILFGALRGPRGSWALCRFGRMSFFRRHRMRAAVHPRFGRVAIGE